MPTREQRARAAAPTKPLPPRRYKLQRLPTGQFIISKFSPEHDWWAALSEKFKVKADAQSEVDRRNAERPWTAAEAAQYAARQERAVAV